MDLHKAIRSIHNEVVTINGDTQETIIATDNDGNKININWTEVNSWIDPDQYKIDRKSEYPSHEDCIHALLDGGDTLSDLQEKRQAVKNKYPKP
tara:strand:- start:6 stop:287 length:282 start_codon:yes stop_codon:yes gene_type:complete